MKKTTVYLSDELKAALERVAAAQGRSEADLIREAIRSLTQALEPPRPKLPLFSGGDPTLAERFDEELRGFGERHFRMLRGPGNLPFRLLPADS